MLPFFIIVLILAGALVGQILWGNQSEEPVGKHMPSERLNLFSFNKRPPRFIVLMNRGGLSFIAGQIVG